MTNVDANPTSSLPPGFRFHPTDEELILHYLRNRAASLPCPVSIIAEVDIYKFDPWELPAKSLFGEREWYFFSPRDRKYPNGVRPNRAAASGYWKATGTDKAIVTSKGNEKLGVKKALVFYKGRPPKGIKTEWIMHEYRLAEAHKITNGYKPKLRDSSMRLDDWVLCRIYKKSSHHSSTDAEQEDSGVEDHVFIPTPGSTTQESNTSFLNLPKSCSLTELFDAVDCSALSRLLENPHNMLGSLENSSINAQPTSLLQSFSSGNFNCNTENNYLVQSLPQITELPAAFMAENSSKRQRVADCCYGDVAGGDLPRPMKKPMDQSRIFTNISNKYEGTQFNFMNHPMLNHQLVMNSQMGSQ